MTREYNRLSNRAALCGLLIVLLGAAGCGLIADTDRLTIAEIGEREITRGDLRMAIREMPPATKPLIRTKGDVRRALENYIDQEIKLDYALDLEAEGKINVPQEIAERVYFMNNRETVDVRQIQDPGLLGMNQQELEAAKAEMQEKIEEMRLDMLREEAMRYRVQQAMATGSIEISQEEYARAYRARKDNLMFPRKAEVTGIVFPASRSESQTLAAEVRRRLEDGEPLDELIDEYDEKGGVPIETMIPEDSGMPQFRSFWQEAEGQGAGAIIGPVFVEASQTQTTNAQGEPQQSRTPASFMVARIERIIQPQQKTLEEAKPDLAPAILYTKVVEQLREEYDVEIAKYEENFPDPSVYEDQVGPAQQGPMQIM